MYRRLVFNLVCDTTEGVWTLAPAYDITYSPEGTNGQHATSLFYEGNPSRDIVIKAVTKIRIPKSTCEASIDKVESVCRENLPHMVRIK